MSNQVNAAFVQQYATNVAHLLQQKGSKLRDSVTNGTATGKAAKVVEQVGAVNAVKRTTRHADTPLISTPHSARWTFPVDYEWADLIDDQDKVRMLINPQSPYAVNGAYAMGRAIDDEILGAFFATSKTGENGSTDESFTGQEVAIDGTTNLTIDQLLEGKRILMANEVDLDNDTIYMAITAEQHEDLLGMADIKTIDSNSTKVLVDGRVRAFLGINFITIERIPGEADPYPLPMWAKSGVHLTVWNDITTKISEREDKSYATQVYVKGTFGATRLELGKVVRILAATD
tara:strand:- start:828 stop:1694 length:867 start_codon:yes stop_codon:yes gene_type:complete